MSRSKAARTADAGAASPTRRRRRERRNSGARPAGRRLLPSRRWARVLIYLVLLLGYFAAMWIWVFPWVDSTFINRPAL